MIQLCSPYSCPAFILVTPPMPGRPQVLMAAIAMRRTKELQVGGRPLVALPTKTIHQVGVQLDAAARAKYERWQSAGEAGEAGEAGQRERWSVGEEVTAGRLGGSQHCAGLGRHPPAVLPTLVQAQALCCLPCQPTTLPTPACRACHHRAPPGGRHPAVQLHSSAGDPAAPAPGRQARLQQCVRSTTMQAHAAVAAPTRFRTRCTALWLPLLSPSLPTPTTHLPATPADLL